MIPSRSRRACVCPWHGLWLAGLLLAGCGPAERVPVAPVSATQGSAQVPPPSAADSSVTTNSGRPALDPGDASDPEGSLLQRGLDAIEAGDPNVAVRRFQELVRLKPDDEEAHFNLGYALTRAKRIPEAMRSYERCLELLPGYAEAHNNLGNLLLGQRKFEEAALHFRVALTNQPESSITRNNLGKVMAVQSRLQEAIPFFREAIELDAKNWDARHNLAVAYMSLGRLEESAAELRVVLEGNPGNSRARATLARVESLMGQKSPPKPSR